MLLVFLLVLGGAPLSAAQVVERAQAQSPGLLGPRVRVQVAQGRNINAGRWLPSNPQLGFELNTDAPFDAEGDGLWRLELQQTLEVAGQPGLRGDWAELEVEAAEARLKATVQATGRAAAEACVRLANAEQQAALLAEAAALSEHLSTVAQRRFSVGEGSALEAAQARVDAERARASAAWAEAEVTSAKATLYAEVGEPVEVETSTFAWVVPTASLEVLLVEAKGQRADLLAVNRAAAATRAQGELLSRSVVPNPTLSVALEREQLHLHGAVPSSGEALQLRDEGWALNVGLSVPLPTWDRRQGERSSNEGQQQLAAELRAATERRVEIEVNAASTKLARAAEARAHHRAAAPWVNRSLELMVLGYERGELPLDALYNQRDRALRSKSERIGAEASYLLALIELYAAVGRPLGREHWR